MAGNLDKKSSTQTTLFTPFVPAEQTVAETTLRAVILGVLIAVVFGVANAYVGLKYGMTVSASIPAAVIAIAVLGRMKKKPTVLENNIVQAIGSSGESLAAGIVFTVPAFFIWSANARLVASGYDFEVSRTFILLLAACGGTLGILLMIPLRRHLVEKEHGLLKFPEGTACAEIMKAGDQGGLRARLIFLGIGLGSIYKVGMNFLRGWSESITYSLGGIFRGGVVGIDATPALMGVGFIIGPRISALMLSGAVLGYLGIGPLLSFIGQQIPGVVIAPGTLPLAEMTPDDLRTYYIKYIGIGAVTLGGAVALIKVLPVIASSFRHGFLELFGRSATEGAPRTSRDLPMKWVVIGVALVAAVMLALPGVNLSLLPVVLALLFGFFFVVVAARIVGLVGSSSSPVSGMTIASLLATCLILLYFGFSGPKGMVAAMSVGAIVCIAVCMSGDIAQDLKTAFLLGATPKKVQLVEFIGLLVPALTMGVVLFYLKDAFGFVEGATARQPLLAPQANVMATVVDGMMNNALPWAPIAVGAMIALAIELLGIASLPFAIGLYLPLSLSAATMSGGVLAALASRGTDPTTTEARLDRGILLASGLVAGDAIIGVLVAFLVGSSESYAAFYDAHEGMLETLTGSWGPLVSLILFGGLALFLARTCFSRKS